jgi:putative PEP-CTERM system TPR-repeat lipoprotein
MNGRRQGERACVVATVCVAMLLAACTDREARKRQYFDNANRLAGEHKYEEAILEYRNALRLDDKFGEAREKLGDLFVASGNQEGAYREYVRAADLMPGNAGVQKKAATVLYLAGQFEDVRSRLKTVLDNNPKDVDAQLLYANSLVGLRDLEGGIREIEEAIEIDPAHATTYTNLAILKLAQGQRQAAREAFEKAVELDPKSVRARLAMAQFHLATGEVPAAEKMLRQALALDAKDPLANRALAVLYVATGRAAAAEEPLKLVAEVTQSPRARFSLADYYAWRNENAKARAILDPMAAQPNTMADAQVRIAQLQYAAGSRREANTQLDTVLKLQPNHSRALQLKARWLLAEGRLNEALERAVSASGAAPRDMPALYLKGTLQALTGQNDAAFKTFNEVLRLNPRAAAAQLQLAQLNLRMGRSEAALGVAREAVSNAPRLPEARLMLARTLVAQHDLPQAENEIDRLLGAYPNAPAVLALKGTVELIKGRAPDARRAFQKAFDLDPTSISAVLGLTMLDAQEGHFAAARKRIEARLEAEPRRPDLLAVAAKVYVAEGNLTKAEDTLKRAMELAPTMTEAYVILGEIYRAQNRLEAAQAEFDAVVTRDPGNVPARTMAAMLAHARQMPAEARKRYEALLSIEPRAAVAANNLAWIYAEEKQNLDQALQLAQQATDLMPDYPEAWDTLGWVYYRKQLPLLAVEPYERALAKDPNNAAVHYHLGLALASGGDRVRARESLQTALKLQPGFADARRELASLGE